ncbi:neuronal cell adhesion molecule-like [Glandiceps talaboti]
MDCDKRRLTVTLNPQNTFETTNETPLILQCNVNLPQQDVDISWHKDGTLVTDGLEAVDGQLQLIIATPQPVDDGIYTCKAKGKKIIGIPVEYHEVELYLQVIIQVPATIVSGPDSGEYNPGEEAAFQCIFHGKPRLASSVKWCKDTNEIQSDIVTVNHGNNDYTMLSTLTVSNVKRIDNGSYSCEVNNGYGAADSASFDLIVLEKPDAVVISSIESTNSEWITVTWTIPFTGNRDITRCYVDYQKISTTNWILSVEDKDSSLSSHTVKHLEPFTYYRVRVSCENSIGKSPYTESGYIRTKVTGSTPPRDVEVMALSDTELRVTWVEPIDHRGNLIHYIVQYNELDGVTHVKQSNGLETSLLLNGLLAYTEYNIEVIAVNEGDVTSLPSNSTIARTWEGIPDAPIIKRFENRPDSQLYVEWEAPVNPRGVIQQYNIHLYKTGGGSAIDTVEIRDLSILAYEFTGLEANTEYFVTITAVNGIEVGDVSSKIYATTNHGIPSAPLNVQINDGTSGCEICWNKPSDPKGDITHYRLEYSIHERDEGMSYSDVADSEGSWYFRDNLDRNEVCYSPDDENDLKAYSAYIIKVYASTYTGEGPASVEARCNTQPDKPPSVEAPERPRDTSRQPTHNSFWMELQRVSERNGRISCYEVIVIQVPENKLTNTPIFDISTNPDEDFPPASIQTFERSLGYPGSGYVAIRMSRNEFKDKVQVGDGGQSTCSDGKDIRSKREVTTYPYDGEVFNGELLPNTWYSAFLRVYVDNENTEGQLIFSSSPLMEPAHTTTESEEKDDNYTELDDIKDKHIYTGLQRKEEDADRSYVNVQNGDDTNGDKTYYDIVEK